MPYIIIHYNQEPPEPPVWLSPYVVHGNAVRFDCPIDDKFWGDLKVYLQVSFKYDPITVTYPHYADFIPGRVLQARKLRVDPLDHIITCMRTGVNVQPLKRNLKPTPEPAPKPLPAKLYLFSVRGILN